jgi:hypothetical protein
MSEAAVAPVTSEVVYTHSGSFVSALCTVCVGVQLLDWQEDRVFST